jgi:fibronectin type 3 domain-containing protein
MKAVLSGAYGATLGPWDIEAVRAVYESATAPVLPATPANLVATATSATRVQLTWGLSTGATSYKVERSSNNGAFVEIATTATNSYTDNAVSGGVTYVYRVRAVNLAGNSNYSNRDHATTIMFTDDPVVSGTPIKAVHITQLRLAVNAMRAAAGLAPASWTDASLTGVTVKAVHITQLRAALTPALTALGKPAPSYSDPSLSAGTPIKAVHIQELRNLVK